VFLILDEVQSSFGRTGRMFAFEHYGIQPDLVTLGKGLGSGVPCSAVLGRSAIMDQLGPGELSSTNGGNPLSCAAAHASLDIIEQEGLVANAARLGPIMGARLAETQAKYPQLGDVRGQGLVFGVELVESPTTKEPAPGLAKAIVYQAYLRGLCLIAPIGMYGSVLRIAPPLVISEAQMLEGLDILEKAVGAGLASQSG